MDALLSKFVEILRNILLFILVGRSNRSALAERSKFMRETVGERLKNVCSECKLWPRNANRWLKYLVTRKLNADAWLGFLQRHAVYASLGILRN
jgi:hypothetical protein